MLIIKVSCIVLKSTYNGQLNFRTSFWKNGSDDVLYNHICSVLFIWALEIHKLKKPHLTLTLYSIKMTLGDNTKAKTLATVLIRASILRVFSITSDENIFYFSTHSH